MTEITQADLKPCPFCGGEACSEKYWPTWDTREARVWCYSECGAEVVRKTEAEAIAVWNTRTDETRHRMEERAAIVAWLRAKNLRTANYDANDIEVGEHLK